MLICRVLRWTRIGRPLLDVVALPADVPDSGPIHGQVGTVIEVLDDTTALVEFSDDQARPYTNVPSRRSELLVPHYAPEAA
jgi:hypothetical protein